jgi:DNA-binding CsgD family transcriptional regulator
MKKEKISLKDSVIITKDNVKQLGEKIAICAVKNAKRFAYGSLDNLYQKLQHDIFYKNTYSDGYDIAQEAICFLCSYIGHELGEICIPNIHKKMDCIRMGCYKHLYCYLRKERKILEQEDIENTIVKVNPDVLAEPENYTNVKKIIQRLNLTQGELEVLKCFYNQMTYKNIKEFLHIDTRTIARRRHRIQAKYYACI